MSMPRKVNAKGPTPRMLALKAHDGRPTMKEAHTNRGSQEGRPMLRKAKALSARHCKSLMPRGANAASQKAQFGKSLMQKDAKY